LVYSTYLGGHGNNYGSGIAVDVSGNTYVVGTTCSPDFPTTPGAFQSHGGDCSNTSSFHCFVTELNPIGVALVYSTYLRGSSEDHASGIALDASGNAYVTGWTVSTDFPITPGAFQTTNGGSFDAFVTKFVLGDQVWPLSLSFGNQNVGTSSAPQTATLTNSGTTALNIVSIAITGKNSSDFFETHNCPQSLAVGGTCSISVTFKPTSPYSRIAAVTITDSAPNIPQTVSLSGIGVGALVTFAPPSLGFGNQTVGTTSIQQVSTLTNTGQLALTITSISVTGANSGDFAATNDCGTSVPAGGSCNIAATFTPSSTGNRTAGVSIRDNAPNSPQPLPLIGVGVLPAVTFSPTSLTFPTQVVFTSSKGKTVTLTNKGPGVLTVTKVGASAPFSQTNTCTTVNPGASCAITVTFKPKTIGSLTGSVSVTDNAPGSPQKVTLTGTGTYIQLAPAGVNFGTQPVGTKSLPKTITLTNKGSVAVSISAIAIAGINVSDFAQTHTCGKSVAAGASCFIKVTFKPTAMGKRTAQLSLSDNGGGSPQKVTLAGTGT
jgi:hypothetical protein